MLGYQIFFIAIILCSSFFGLGTYFLVVAGSVIFTLVNVYSMGLLILQLGVISITAFISFFIATSVSIKRENKDDKTIRKSKKDKDKYKYDDDTINLFMFTIVMACIGFIFG